MGLLSSSPVYMSTHGTLDLSVPNLGFLNCLGSGFHAIPPAANPMQANSSTSFALCQRNANQQGSAKSTKAQSNTRPAPQEG